MFRLRPFVVLLSLVLALCLLGLWRTRSQAGGLRRVTTTTEEGINVNPSLSGDGLHIAFESTEDLAHAGGSDHFRALRADIASDPATFTQLGGTRAPAPGISQDGSRIAFAAKEDPLGTNPDGNSEIFYYNGATLKQITNTTPADPSTRTRDGNFQPSLTDDGRFIAFASNRNLTNQNADGNFEIFIYDTIANTFTQLTNTAGTIGATDAKISGDGTRIAYIRDNGATASTQRDLILQDRIGSTTRVLANNVTNIAFTYGRAISDDGSRVVYAADIAPDSSQVFLFDGRTTNSVRQITSLGVRTTEVPLHPTISGDGTRIAFATRRTVTGLSNTDNSIELYTYDIPTGQFARVTNAPSSADGFSGSTRVAEVVSSLNDDGSIIAFNFPRVLSGAVTSGMENNSEIYVTATAARPITGSLTVLNGASFGHETSTTKAVAPNSIAVALGSALSFTTVQSQKQPDGSFPATLGGTTVTVNNRAAQIFFVSPTQVNFLVPPQTEIGTATVTVTNSEGFQSRGTVTILRAAPGIFTYSGDGLGEAVVLNADTLQPGPFDPTSGNLRLIIFTTGVRNASQVTVTAGGRALAVESFAPSRDMPGMDEVHVLVPSDLRGAGPVSLVVRADGRDSNAALITFSGNACRDIVINEVLADPPDGIAGDANLDGVRSSNDDEFVELVNTTANNIDIGGYQLLTRSSSSTTDTVRHTFPSGTLFPAGSAIVIFGGGNFNPNNPAFGSAQVFKASSGALSLTNSGGVVTLSTPAQEIVNLFSYGGSTGLDGDANQSLTRSPDAGGGTCGNFVLHTTAPGSNGRAFSPGTRVDGSPFATGVGRLASITISPASASVTRGGTTQFTAQAKDQFNRPMTGVTITFISDNTGVATVDSVSTVPTTGIATATLTGRSAGTAHITAQATDGTTTVNSNQATLTVNEPPPVVTRVDVSPSSSTINRGQMQQFTATAFDQNNQPLAGASFTWSSSNTNVATINANGLATGVGLGSTTITASTTDATGMTASGTATLNVQVPLVINEILADPPDGIAGDSNRDGVRDADDDEFVELVNNSNAPVDISGVIIADSTSNHFTFPANTTLAAGRAVVIFGGGSPNASDPAFGGALIFTTSTLSLGNTADTVNVKLAVGGTDVLIASQTYSAEGNDNQSLTRSPDLTGAFTKHSTVANSDGRLFSPGTRTDGTPFGSPPITRIEVTPTSAAINIGQTQNFTAQAFSDTGGTEVEVQNVSFVWDSSDATKATVSPTTGQSTTATALASGITSIRARAGGQQGAGNLTVNPTLSINNVSLNEGNSGTTTFTFTVSLSTPAPTGGVKFNIATEDGTATVADNDYVARSLTSQVIPAGSQTYTFDVAVNGDTKIEPNETFIVNVTNVTGASISQDQGTGTILNDDSPSLSINDVSKSEGNSGTTAFTFTVTLSSVSNQTVTVDYATADGSATAGSDYTATSGTLTFSPGDTAKTITVVINGDTLAEPDETFFVNLTNAQAATLSDAQGQGTITNDDTANLVISQVYGGGNNSGAQYQNDFIEIFNRGTVTVDFSVTPYSVQYAGATVAFGAANTKTDITSGTIAPGHYFLIQESGGTANGVALPTPNATGNINLAATAGKVALVSGTTALSATTCPGDDGIAPFNPNSSTIVDFVGYGSSANCYEGTAPAAAPSNSTADFRKAGGCVDTNDNAADFIVSAPNPRNSSSPANDCSAGIKPDITINDVSVTEGDTGTKTVDFTVTLSTASTETVTVGYMTADGTATAGSDYQPTSGTLTFNPGELTKTITVTIIGDTLDEPNETFFVNLSNATNGLILDGQGQGTINDNDPAPTISINDVSVTEGDSGTTQATFTISLSSASGFTVTVNYATADGTATAGIDYQATSGTLTFNPGETMKQITVPVNGDTTFEADETFFVNLTNATNATINDNQGQGTIKNDDAAPPLPAISINDVSVAEGDSGTKTVDFTVSLPMPSAQTVTVQYATADGAATAPTDYQSARGTLTFNIGETQKTITVIINGDTLVEPDETFFVNLSNPTNAIITDAQGQGTITNDDTANLVISQIYQGGGLSNAIYTNDFVEIFNHGTTTVDFSVTPFSIQFLSTSGSAWAKTDLTTKTLAPGQYFLVQETSGGSAGIALPTPDASGSINLTSTTPGKVALVSGTTLLAGSCPGDDGTQPFNPSGTTVVDFVGYSGTSATANHCYEGTGPATYQSGNNTIADFRKNGGCTDTNDNAADFIVSTPSPRNTGSPLNNCASATPPDLSINDVTVTEGNGATITATFTVSLSAPAPSTDVTFDIATQDNTATTANNDYVAKSLTNQVIPAGQQTYTFSVTVNGDTNVEPDETFFVNVTNVAGANVLKSKGTGTIKNDDLPALSITDVSQKEGNTGTSTFTFQVNLSAPAPADVFFDIATQDNTATVTDNDYVANSATAQKIPAGQQSFNFNVTVNGDTKLEPDETFFVNVTNVSGATVSKSQGTGTILNDDSPILSINNFQMSEGNTGTTTFTFTVSLSPASNQTVTVNYATADGTATTAGNDYQATSGTLTFTPGDTTKTFDVLVNGDTLVEPNETFFVNLSGATGGASIGTSQGTGTIQNDDTANLVISQVYEGGGLSNAIYTNDFVEIFNRGTTTVDISVTPLSVQFLSTSGSTWTKTDITSNTSKTLAPGKYFLVQETSGGAAGAPLPTPDATGTINITSTVSGKVALVEGTTLLTGSCPGDDGTQPFNPSNSTVLDFVGYGGTSSTANHCYEGSGPAPYTLSNNTIADLRKGGGCVDTNDNAQDFTTAAPNPRNSASPTNDCSAADLSITKTDSPDPVDAGGNVTYTLAVTNNSTFNAAQNVSVTDAIPNNTTFVSVGTIPNGWTRTDSVTTGGTGTITFTNPSLAASATATFTLTVKVDANAANNTTISNTANVSSSTADSDTSNNTATQVTTVHRPADLSISKSVDTPTPTVNSNVIFTIKLSNAGANVATNVAVTDQLPSGLSFVSSSASQGSYDSSSGIWTVGSVTVGNNVATLTMTATVTSTTQLTNTARITSSDEFDPNTSNNQSSASVTAGQATSADLSITKVDSPDPVAIGNDITYTITLTNNGLDPATSAVLSETVPTNTTFRSITPPNGWTCPTVPNVGSTGSISCTNSNFGVGSAVFTLIVRVNTSVTDGTTISNTASVSSSTTDPGPNANSATQTTTVKQPLLVISQIYPGGGNTSATYTNDFVEIFNRGTTTVDFSVTPYSIQYVGTSGSFGSTSASNLTIINSGTIAPGQYFLIQEASGGAVGVALPTPDASGSINLSATSGKVALVLGTAALPASTCPGDDGTSPFNPSNSTIVDFVGYGGTATTTGNCYEGSGPAPFSGTNSNARSTIRTSSCTDTNNNSADFSNPTTAPTARNKLTTKVTCP